jgi:hypothetical protein
VYTAAPRSTTYLPNWEKEKIIPTTLTSGFAFGNNVIKFFFFLNGSALMYSLDLWEVMA